MRTMIDIDEDVLELVKDIARSQRRSAGAVMSELVRKALRGGARPGQPDEFVMKDGWVVLAAPATDIGRRVWATSSSALRSAARVLV